jgi:hypothetical protein
VRLLCKGARYGFSPEDAQVQFQRHVTVFQMHAQVHCEEMAQLVGNEALPLPRQGLPTCVERTRGILGGTGTVSFSGCVCRS